MFVTLPSSVISLFILLMTYASSLKLLTAALSPPLCHPDDAAALLALKTSFGNPPSLSGWGNLSAPCCPDRFLFCNDDTGRVTGLIVREVPGLSGRISPAIARLTALDSILIFQNPNLTGPVPSSIGNLPNLTSLSIMSNPNLSGPIPNSICHLTNLTDFDLSSNALTGPIPDCIGTKLTRTPGVFLNNNRLTGPIPRSLGDSPAANVFLSHNRLTGDASFMVDGEKKPLESLYLSYNQLEFNLSAVRFPLRLWNLYLNNNKIYGRIPTQISKLGQLHFFNVSFNNLCGPIPTAGFMKKFDASSFSHNKCLCDGPLKPCHLI